MTKLKEMEDRKPAGFNCPKCNFFIEISIESLLYDKPIRCPGCSTHFSMDRDEQGGGIEQLQELQRKIDNIDSLKEKKEN